MTCVSDFVHQSGGHCASSALRDLLEFQGLSYDEMPLNEAAVFGLSGALAFHYVELPGASPVLYLVGRSANLEQQLCRTLGISLELRQTDDPGTGWGWVRTALERGEPTMVWADIKHLDYLNVRMHNTMHDIVITGYDDELGIAYIADNDRDEIQTCTLDSLARARNSDAFPGANRHATWIMKYPARLPPVNDAVEMAIRSSIANMQHPEGGIGGAGHAGMSGLDRFAESFARWPATFGDDLHAANWALGVFITKAGTGGAMFRSLYAGFLSWAATALNDAQLHATAAAYEEIAEFWRLLASAEHHHGVQIARDLALAERNAITLQQRWLKART